MSSQFSIYRMVKVYFILVVFGFIIWCSLGVCEGVLFRGIQLWGGTQREITIGNLMTSIRLKTLLSSNSVYASAPHQEPGKLAGSQRPQTSNIFTGRTTHDQKKYNTSRYSACLNYFQPLTDLNVYLSGEIKQNVALKRSPEEHSGRFWVGSSLLTILCIVIQIL